MKSVPWFRTLAWRFFLGTALTVLGLAAALFGLTRSQGRKEALGSAEAGIRVSSQIMASSLEHQGRIMEAVLEVFTTYHQNMTSIEQQDFSSVREHLLENLATLKALRSLPSVS